jgi:uncharacterized protein YggT (Ycf19 family)
MATYLMLAVRALELLIIADAIFSWIMPPDQFPRSLTTSITEPLYAPIRALIGPDKLGGIDISPLAMLLLLHLMRNMLISRL